MKTVKTIKDIASEYVNNVFSSVDAEGISLREDLRNAAKGAVREAFESGAKVVIDELELMLNDYDRYDRMSCYLIREFIKKLKGE